jgi:hypothetical protein
MSHSHFLDDDDWEACFSAGPVTKWLAMQGEEDALTAILGVSSKEAQQRYQQQGEQPEQHHSQPPSVEEQVSRNMHPWRPPRWLRRAHFCQEILGIILLLPRHISIRYSTQARKCATVPALGVGVLVKLGLQRHHPALTHFAMGVGHIRLVFKKAKYSPQGLQDRFMVSNPICAGGLVLACAYNRADNTAVVAVLHSSSC